MIENSRNISEAQFSVIICGDKLDFDSVTAQLGLAPTKLIHNGEQLSRLPSIVSNEDAWYYTMPLSNPEGSDKDLISMFEKLRGLRGCLESLTGSGCRLTLRLALTTDKAFMGYRLNPDTLKVINEVGFPLDITTVSWGDVGF